MCVDEAWADCLFRRVNNPLGAARIYPSNLDYPVTYDTYVSLEPRISCSVEYFSIHDGYIKRSLHVSRQLLVHVNHVSRQLFMFFVIIALGINLMLKSGLAKAFTLGLSIPSLVYRGKVEDKLLRKKFGEE